MWSVGPIRLDVTLSSSCYVTTVEVGPRIAQACSTPGVCGPIEIQCSLGQISFFVSIDPGSKPMRQSPLPPTPAAIRAHRTAAGFTQVHVARSQNSYVYFYKLILDSLYRQELRPARPITSLRMGELLRVRPRASSASLN
jgi:hypothetical protein